jgi:hypothetical protein
MLTYQWYQRLGTEPDPATDTAVGTASSFTIPTGLTMQESPYYYYCVVSAEDAVSVTSNVSMVTVDAPSTTYIIIYNANGGTGAPPNQPFTIKTWATVSTIQPTLAGGIFLGWSTNPSSNTVNYSPGEWIYVDSMITLYAVWYTPESAAYRLEYSGYESANQSFTIKTWATVNTTGPIPPLSGSTFLGWSTSPSSNTIHYMPGEWIYVDSVITLYAVWYTPVTAAYKLVYSGMENADQSFIAKTWATISVSQPTQIGSIFRGWSTSQSATNVDYLPGEWIYVDSVITLYPVWYTPEAAAYRLEYNDDINSATVPAIQSFSAATWSTISTMTPTSAGFVFQGWSTNPSATNVDYLPGEWIYVDRAITLYAVWYTPETAAYKLMHYGFSAADQSFTIKTWAAISTLQPTLEGSIFCGWSTNPSATTVQYLPGEWIYVDSAITLYPVWYIPQASAYRLEYYDDIMNAGLPQNQTFTIQTWATISNEIPTAAGATFRGWSTSPQANSVQHMPGEWIYVDRAIKLYAVWQ